MNVLILGERQFLQNYQAQQFGDFKLIDFHEDWRGLVDPVKCEAVFNNIVGVIHTGISNYQSSNLVYKELLLPLQSIIDHLIEIGLPIVYVSDWNARHKSPRDTSQEYFHHLAEVELQRLNVEGGKGWILRPALIIDEPSLSGMENNSTENGTSYRVTTVQQILDQSLELIRSQPHDRIHALADDILSGNELKLHGQDVNNSFFRKKKQFLAIENYRMN